MKSRVKKLSRVCVLGVWGTGETPAQAKKDAHKAIESSLAGEYTPIIISRSGIDDFAVVYREPFSGWSYMLPNGCAISNGGEKGKTIESASYHMEQNAWTPESDDTFPLLDPYPQSKQNLQHWARWQRDFARIMQENGGNAQDAYQKAKG